MQDAHDHHHSMAPTFSVHHHRHTKNEVDGGALDDYAAVPDQAEQDGSEGGR